MDSDEETLYDDVDSGNESSGDDVGFPPMEVDPGNHHKDRPNETEEYPFEVLSTEEIVQHMVDCIKEVNTVVEVRIKLISQATKL
jgi:ariadne-1